MTRTRSEVVGPIVEVYRIVNQTGGLVFSANHTVASSTKTMTDTVTPNFRKRVKAGEVINNAAIMTEVTALSTGTSGGKFILKTNPLAYQEFSPDGKGSNTRYVLSQNAGLAATSNLVPSQRTSLTAQAKQTAIANIDQSDFSIGQDIAELRETLNLLRNPLGSLERLSRAFKKDLQKYLLRRKGKEVTKAIAEVYASYQFGISPLLRSADTIARSLLMYDKPTQRRTARGFAYGSGSKSERKQTSGNVIMRCDHNHELTESVQAVILYETENVKYSLLRKYGIEPRDFPSIYWEVLPYSFMVDRVINIGNMVAGVRGLTSPGVRILSACSRYKATRTLTSVGEYVSHGSYNRSYWHYDPYVSTTFTYDRSVWVPSFGDTVPIPKFSGLVDSATKVTDLVSLILLAFTSGKGNYNIK